MRLYGSIMVMLLLAAGLFGQSDDSDPYALDVVRQALAMRTGPTVVIQSWNQKHLSRLGDGVAIALIKLLDESQIRDPVLVQRILPIIGDAFAEPQFISLRENRKPSATLFLLGCLRRTLDDAQARAAVEQMASNIKQRSGQ